MASAPSSHSNTAHIGMVCKFCVASETPERRLQKCGQCKVTYYCSSQCQKADWPQHKKQCQARTEALDSMKATCGEDFVTKQNKWVAKLRPHLTSVTHSLLGDRLLTHVVVLSTEYKASSKRPFKVVEYKVSTPAQIPELNAASCQAIYEQMRLGLQMGGSMYKTGYAIVFCRNVDSPPRLLPLGQVPEDDMTPIPPEMIIAVMNRGG